MKDSGAVQRTDRHEFQRAPPGNQKQLGCDDPVEHDRRYQHHDKIEYHAGNQDERSAQFTRAASGKMVRSGDGQHHSRHTAERGDHKQQTAKTGNAADRYSRLLRRVPWRMRDILQRRKDEAARSQRGNS